MKHRGKLFLLPLALVACVVHAQTSSDVPFNPHNAVRLAQTTESLVNALESASPGLQATAAQTVRELKDMLPDESFSSLIIPLMRVVKDPDAVVESRIMCALALHELHSERGDFAIKGEAIYAENTRFQRLCAALTAKKQQDEMRALQAEKANQERPVALNR
jgi:hypothetical protein